MMIEMLKKAQKAKSVEDVVKIFLKSKDEYDKFVKSDEFDQEPNTRRF